MFNEARAHIRNCVEGSIYSVLLESCIYTDAAECSRVHACLFHGLYSTPEEVDYISDTL
jgi:hypothetical protein